MKLKMILIEAFLVIEAALCWMVLLPAAAFFFLGCTLWQKAAALTPRGPAGPARTGMSPVAG